MKRLLFGIVLLASPAAAQNLAETLMQPGLLAEMADESLPCYAHSRSIPSADGDTDATEEIEDERLCLARSADQPDRYVELILTDAGQPRVIAQLPIETSNPFLLFFLENVVRNVATQTGGSPYYIRNRIRDALISGQQEEREDKIAQAVLQPFIGDPNRARLGEFADMVLTLRYDPDDPLRLLQLSVDTGDGQNRYTETMTLLAED